jgi:catechol 2,3-dioxygenase-like lactoylglutathione lyase family enzyme
LHQTMRNAPPIGGAHHPIFVVAADDEGVATLSAREHMLTLQLAAVRPLVTIDADLMIADEVLGGIETQNRSTDAFFDRIAALTGHAMEHACGIGGEDLVEAIDVAGIERPCVGDGKVDDGGAVIHDVSVPQRHLSERGRWFYTPHMVVPAGLGTPAQIAYAVPDVDRAAAHWATRVGAGPFIVRRHIELDEVWYRGEASMFDHSSAYGQWGSVMVELVQDHGSTPSAVRERFGPDESGLHHVAHIVDDLEAAIAYLHAHGYATVMSARTSTDVWFHFLECTAADGPDHLIELYERSPGLVGFYEMVAAAANGWDGRDPFM